MEHEEFMRAALTLAKKGIGKTSPNPAVGAVIVKHGKVVGKGYHKKAGTAHAEVLALRQAGGRAKGSDLYITLEPCVHFGRTPPCVDAIVAAGVKKVFVGMIDPNHNVKGKGVRELKKAGIEVTYGILKDECRKINEPYIKHITTGLPFVILKLASTLDGKIATKTGESKWITSLEARKYVHRLRSIVDCVMIGSGTVLKDDPLLDVRLIKGRNPSRAVLDSRLKIPASAKFLLPSAERFVFTSKMADKNKINKFEEKGAHVIIVPEKNGMLNLNEVFKELGKRGIMSVMVEGGASVAASLIKQKLIDKMIFFLSPMIIGGDGVGAVGELGIKKLKDAVRIREVNIKKVGNDLMIEGCVLGNIGDRFR